MITIKRNISFVVEKKKNSSPAPVAKKNKVVTSRVRCVVTWHGQRVRLSIGHDVNPDNWEPLLQRCMPKTTHGVNKTPAYVINHDIDNIESLINSIFRMFEEKDVLPTPNEVTREYDKLTKGDGVEDEAVDIADRPLFPIYDDFVKDGTISGRWTHGTLVKVKTIRKHLESLSPTISLNELIQGGINTLIEYFSRVPDSTKHSGLTNSTIKKDIAFVKTFLRWAQEHDYCDANALLNQRVKLKTTNRPVVYLTWEELMTVYNFDFKQKNYLSHVRDVFCFCCFTSLRYSDAYNLRRANVSDSEIRIVTVKTHDSLTIELNKYSKAILEKYADTPFPGDRALPVISNQRMNEYLKEMGEICGIDSPITITQYKGAKRFDTIYKKYELLSTHCGRRTFISNAIMLGVPPNIVMKWTGHSDYKTMRPYLAIADKAKKSAMAIFDKLDEDGNIAP